MHIRNVHWITLFCASIFCANGCSEQQTRFPVAGKVLIDGEPVPTGSIQFVPVTGRPFVGKIERDGTFRLTDSSVSNEQSLPGVPIGMYQIGISSAEVIDEDKGEILRHIPSHYADYRQSDLKMEITKAEEDLVIELTWKGFEETDEEAEETEKTTEMATEGSTLGAEALGAEAAKEE